MVTSGDPESQNCFQFVLGLRVQFAQKGRDRSLPFFLAGWPTGIDDSCKIGLLSLHGRCYGKKFVIFRHFSPERTLFCHPQAPVVRLVV